ncbi:YppG family protein [Bacillus sp. CECT 9360]|uniref:YppG family protein n=1 Tax=Bacillus sp. CECT 9360 TaxID=2845821 RepID=UPI001E600FD7|nr:YppG family protein [Bacillus sp. CECT 9360]CAH0345500.1 hypothetical protein BCI9360_01787 [Bacillus sp. CECT 9360]
MNIRNSVSRQERHNGHYRNAMPEFWDGHPYVHGQYAVPQEMNILTHANGMGYYQGHMHPPQYGAGMEIYPGSQQVLQQYPPPYNMPVPPMPYTPNPFQQPPKKINSFNPFENPLQPIQKRPPAGGPQHFANPYPKQQFMKKPHPSGLQSVLNQFKLQDGSMDINKMMNTAGQMMNTFGQVSAMVKGFGDKLKV